MGVVLVLACLRYFEQYPLRGLIKELSCSVGGLSLVGISRSFALL